MLIPPVLVSNETSFLFLMRERDQFSVPDEGQGSLLLTNNDTSEMNLFSVLYVRWHIRNHKF